MELKSEDRVRWLSVLLDGVSPLVLSSVFFLSSQRFLLGGCLALLSWCFAGDSFWLMVAVVSSCGSGGSSHRSQWWFCVIVSVENRRRTVLRQICGSLRP